MIIMHPDCDEVLKATGVTKGGTATTGATLTYAIKNSGGTTLAGGTGTLAYSSALSAAAGVPVYAATVESTVTTLMAVDGYYRIEVTFVEGDYNDFRKVRIKVEDRAET